MPVASRVSYASRVRSVLKRWLWRLFAASLIIFATVGVLTAVMFVVGGHWTLSDPQRPFLFVVETKEYFKLVWAEVKTSVQYLSFFLIAVALFLAVIRLGTVAKIISDFLLARGPIYTMQGTIERVSETVERLSLLEPTIQLLNEKIDAAKEQVEELQRYTASQRHAGGENFEKLRSLWYAQARRIEGVIDRIANARRKQRYRNMARTEYTPILTALGRDRLITPAAEEASVKLDQRFNDYLSGKEPLTDEAIEQLRVLDAMLGELIGAPPAEDEDETSKTS